MTTLAISCVSSLDPVVEAYRLDRYDNRERIRIKTLHPIKNSF